jgi:hypothetical protein
MPGDDKLAVLEQQLEILEGILGIDPGAKYRCSGSPSECGDVCTEEQCPLKANRLTELGSLIVSLLHEFRWHRAWAEEMVRLRVVPASSLERVELMVKRMALEERLRSAEASLEAVQGVQVLQDTVSHRVNTIRSEIEAIDQRIAGADL